MMVTTRSVSNPVSFPRVRQPAPAFSATAVVNGAFEKVTNETLFKGSYGVLFFYPLDFTFVSWLP